MNFLSISIAYVRVWMAHHVESIITLLSDAEAEEMRSLMITSVSAEGMEEVAITLGDQSHSASIAAVCFTGLRCGRQI